MRILFAFIALIGIIQVVDQISTANAQGTNPVASDDRASMFERERKCGAEWRAAKAAGAIPDGTTWPIYLSNCDKKLQAREKNPESKQVSPPQSAQTQMPEPAQAPGTKQVGVDEFKNVSIYLGTDCDQPLQSQSYSGPLKEIWTVRAHIEIHEPKDDVIFLNESMMGRFFNYVKSRARHDCRSQLDKWEKTWGAKKEMRPATSIYIFSQGIGEIAAIAVNETSGWIVVENTITENFKVFEVKRKAQEEANRQAQIQAQRIAQDKQALQTKVRNDLGYQSFVRTPDLIANPFVYKGVVVAVQTIFARMLAENEAVFSWNNQEILATGVPTTAFRGNETVILGIKVLGTKAVKTPGGEVTLPYGEYVGAYKCARSDCSEYF